MLPRAPLLVLALALLTGCVAPRLVDERRQAPYAGLLATYEALPRSTERYEVVAPDGERVVGVALEHVRAEHRGAGGDGVPTLVLQPGILASGGTWRFLAGALAGTHELLLVDPPGTGASDAPDARTLGPTAYSPGWLAGCTLGAIEAFERAHGPRASYVLVGHSLGGAVVLRALGDPGLRTRHAALLARVRGALLFNPADILLASRSERLLDMAQISDLEVGIGERLGVLMKEVRTGVRENVLHPERDALRAEALRIEALVGRPATRHAMQAMLRRFQPLQADGRTLDRPAAERLAAHERSITQPVRILWGTADATLARAQGDALCARLPTCRLIPLEGIGHSSHQEGVLGALGHVRAFLAELATGTTQP